MENYRVSKRDLIINGVFISIFDILVAWGYYILHTTKSICSNESINIFGFNYTYCYIDWIRPSHGLIMLLLIIGTTVLTLAYIIQIKSYFNGKDMDNEN